MFLFYKLIQYKKNYSNYFQEGWEEQNVNKTFSTIGFFIEVP